MRLAVASALGLAFALSEVALALLKRAKQASGGSADRGSLRLLWIVIGISVTVSYRVAVQAPAYDAGDPAVWLDVGMGLFAVGLVLRWYAILYLGRFFTVDVAIATDHRLIDRGPYRFIRHPSYSGALLAFAGLGLTMQNGAAVAVILLPTIAAFAWRIRIEEAALLAGLGGVYRDYMRRTKRLIPAIY